MNFVKKNNKNTFLSVSLYTIKFTGLGTGPKRFRSSEHWLLRLKGPGTKVFVIVFPVTFSEQRARSTHSIPWYMQR